MALVAVHSHLLFILLTTYFNLLVFVVVGGQKAFHIFTKEMSHKTAAQLEEQFEGIKVLISFSLHCATLICTLLCVVFTNSDKIKTKMPPTVVVVILVFNSIFNLIAAILLIIYKPKEKEERSVLLAGGIVSGIAVLIVVGVLLYFIKWPPTTLVVVEIPLPQKPADAALGGPVNVVPVVPTNAPPVAPVKQNESDEYFK